MSQPKRYNADSALQEIVNFADGPIATSAEWRQTLAHVIQADTGVVVLGDTASELQDWTPGQMMQLRKQLRDFLRAGLNVDRAGQQLPTFRVEFAPVIVGSTVLLTVDGRARDVIWFQAASLMRAVGLSRFRQCACGRVFAKIGRSEYCSSKCQKRFYMRKYRRDQEASHAKTARTRRG
jgi:hypothetical protein